MNTKAKPWAISFSALWSAYPNTTPYLDSKTNEAPKGYENQCAIKVSVALTRVGVKLTTFRGATVQVDGDRAAIRAEELALWLKQGRIPGLPTTVETVTGSNWRNKVAARVGIIYFGDYWLRPGQVKPTGDHIDLWNGSRLTASGLSGSLVTIARFGLGITAGPGFSDLGKSTSILFWELK
jgi:hypothetical protein